MSGVSNKHSIGAVVFNATVLGGITQLDVQTGTEAQGEATSGEPYTRYRSIVAQKPTASFSTLAVAAALDLCGSMGSSIADLAAGLIMYITKHADGSTRSAGATHRKYTAVQGIVYPQQLSVDHQGHARLSYAVAPTWDGTNDPIVETDTVALPTADADTERFSIGPVTIGAVTIAQIRSLTIDFGVNVATEGADSEIFDRFAGVVDVNPRITLSGIDIEWLKSSNIPRAGKVGTQANTSLYLRKRAEGGTFTADATEEHIKIDAAGLAYVTQAFSGSGNQAGETQLVMDVDYDGSNDPLTIDTTAALP